MALFHSGNLVVADSVQLIVGDWCYLCLELVKLNGDVLVIKCLQGDWVGGVVDKYVRVHTYLYQVDNIVIDNA